MLDADESSVVEREPLSYRIAKWLQSKRIRGGYRFEHLARFLGWLDVDVRYPLCDRVSLDVPISPRPYDAADLMRYEAECIDVISGQLEAWSGPTLLLDCGADIGLMSARLVSTCPVISSARAFEPNTKIFQTLSRNMQRLPIDGMAINMAVADFTGRGGLSNPDHDKGDHAAFLVPSEEGSIEVGQIDTLELPEHTNLLLKVDVEGGERAVIAGAMETLKRSKRFAVLFEAHRDQVARAGIDPVDVAKLITALRPCGVVVVEDVERPVDLERPFFDQFPGRIYNLLVSST